MTTVVSDTSPLVAFAFLQLEALLPKMLGEILIGPAVAHEVARARYGFAGVRADSLPGVMIKNPTSGPVLDGLKQRIDAGEAESLALAIEVKADLVVLDDAAARIAALELGLTITGTIGLLLRAKASGHVAVVRPLLDRLVGDLHFFVSQDLYDRALSAAGE